MMEKNDSETIPGQVIGTRAASSVKANTPVAVIGSKIHIKGDLSGDEDILIQGVIEGTIELKQHALTIGQNGVIKANAVAKSITIEGKVEGDLFGDEHITIRKTSDVRGNVSAPRISLEDGAKFHGSMDMEGKVKPVLKPQASTDTSANSSKKAKTADKSTSSSENKSEASPLW